MESKIELIGFRNLRADEIDVRVGSINEKGASLLLYQDSRCAMDILDEAVGPMNWQRLHSRDNANCIISIWDENKKQWVSKEDTGTESNTEKEKGLASDSFKRSAVNWGIGRALYTSPFIWVDNTKMNIIERNGKKATNDKFIVEKIRYNDKDVIIGLAIKNINSDKICFTYVNKEEVKRMDELEKQSKEIAEQLKENLKKEGLINE